MSRVVDSHLHIWDLGVTTYSWLTPDRGPLYRSFSIEEAAATLARADVQRAVLVQAADSEAETAHLMRTAESSPWVSGVVGWIALDDPGTAGDQLERYGGRLCGVRHLVHDDPRDDFLELPAVRCSLALAATRGLPLDVPDAWPRHLRRIAQLADALPELTVVVDHLGKPPRGTDQMASWADVLREVARRPNVVAKVSGLQRPGQPFTPAALRPVIDTALEAFGTQRLMYGSDWPLTVPLGGHGPHWRVIRSLIEELGPTEQDEVLHATAAKVYRLADTPSADLIASHDTRTVPSTDADSTTTRGQIWRA